MNVNVQQISSVLSISPIKQTTIWRTAESNSINTHTHGKYTTNSRNISWVHTRPRKIISPTCNYVGNNFLKLAKIIEISLEKCAFLPETNIFPCIWM